MYNLRHSCNVLSAQCYCTLNGNLRCKITTFAIAALTLVGAASAQVTLTGTVSFSQESALTSNQRGLAMTDNSIFLGVTEDLGGGLKVGLSSGFDAGGRGAVGQEDASMYLSGGFGKLTLKSYESDSAAEGALISGASLNQGVHDTQASNIPPTNRMGIVYTTPALTEGVTASIAYVRKNAGNNVYDTSDAKSNDNKVGLSVNFARGAFSGMVGFTSLDSNYSNQTIKNSDGTTTTGVSAGGGNTTNFVLKYDAGVVAAALGMEKNSWDSNGTYTWGLNAPMGAFSLGIDGAVYNGGTFTEVGAVYNLSKSTAIKASYGSLNSTAQLIANALVANSVVNTSEYRVGLFKSF